MHRSFPDGTTALRGIDLRFSAGQSVAIVGRSGSGKTTLLSILGLLDMPTEGQVYIDGAEVPVRERHRAALRAHHLAFVFQRADLIGGLTARDNVMMALRYAGASTSEGKGRAKNALEAVGLEHRIDAKAKTLSGGEMQRVAIARAVARPGMVWLADEPTGNLDSAQSREIIDLLLDTAREQGSTLITVTHEPEIAARFDRIITLSDGAVSADTDPEAARRSTAPARSPKPNGTERGTLHRSLLRKAADAVGFAVGNVRANQPRSVGAVVAAGLAVALTVVAIGLAQSAEAQVADTFDAQLARQISAQVQHDLEDPPRGEISLEVGGLTLPDLDQLMTYPGVVHAEAWSRWGHQEIRNGEVATTEALVISAAGHVFEATDSRILWSEPVAPSSAAVPFGPGTAVVGHLLAQRLHLTQPDLRPALTIAGSSIRIVGILQQSRSGEAAGALFLHPEEAELLGDPFEVDVFVETRSGSAPVVAQRLPGLLDPYDESNVSVAPVLRTDAHRAHLEREVSTSLTVLAAVAALAGLLVVLSVHVLSIANRRAEIGVRRAFGASGFDLISMVLAESFALSALAAAGGGALGFVVIMGVTIQAGWFPVFSPTLIILGATIAVALGAIGGIVPAIAASRVEPSDAVRS